MRASAPEGSSGLVEEKVSSPEPAAPVTMLPNVHPRC